MDMFIDGKWQPAVSGKTNPVNDPTTSSAFDTVPDAGGEDAEVKSAIGLNDIQRSSHYVPFGGMKECGLGRGKGRYGVEAHLEYKTIYLSYEVPL